MVNGRWQQVARSVGLMADDGTVSSTIFAEMSMLAQRTGAINLGQGYPDVDGPQHLKDIAVSAINGGGNQYAPGPGALELRQAVTTHQRRYYGLEPDPEQEVLVTAGATEALSATLLALTGPGDEVITLEPYYDAYAAAIALSGATHRTIGLHPTGDGFRIRAEDVRAAFGPRTRLVLINTPHNPTGTVLSREELMLIAGAAVEHDAIVVTDEVYEHLTYDDAEHIPIASLPGMAGRTVTISSAGKTLSFTGWRIGWLHAPAELVTAIRSVKQFLSYVPAGPFQPAVASALADEDGRMAQYVEELRGTLEQRRDVLCEALTDAGFAPVVPRGTYFVVADATELGHDDGVALCARLPELTGVVAIPVSAFCAAGSPVAEALRPYVRFTYVKSVATLEAAAKGLARLR